MNFFKKFKLPFSQSKNKNYTLFTGSHLKFTQQLIHRFSKDYSQLPILVLNRYFNNEESSEASREYDTSLIDALENVQIFNCDPSNSEDTEELTIFLQNNQLKVNNKFIIYLGKKCDSLRSFHKLSGPLKVIYLPRIENDDSG
jgi:hypothetical protein